MAAGDIFTQESPPPGVGSGLGYGLKRSRRLPFQHDLLKWLQPAVIITGPRMGMVAGLRELLRAHKASRSRMHRLPCNLQTET